MGAERILSDCLCTGRTAALVFMGFCIKFANPNVDWDAVGSTTYADYHIIWIVSGLSALAGILILSTVRDFRFEKANASPKIPC